MYHLLEGSPRSKISEELQLNRGGVMCSKQSSNTTKTREKQESIASMQVRVNT